MGEESLPMKTAVSSLLVASIRHLIGADQYPSHWRTERNPFALEDLPCARSRPYQMVPLSSSGYGMSRLADDAWSPNTIVWEAIVVLMNFPHISVVCGDLTTPSPVTYSRMANCPRKR